MRDVAAASFQKAVGFTVAALLLLIGGSIGYSFTKRVGESWGHWSDGPVLWELMIGLLCAGVAAFYWRRAVLASDTKGSSSRRILSKR